MQNTVKKQFWEFVFYPESMPEGCIENFAKKGISCCYILHDKDIDLDTGELKKQHYHLLLDYGAPTTYKNILNIAEEFFNTKRVEWKFNIPGAYKYLNHSTEDAKNKYQYDQNDIKCLNGFSILNYPITSNNKYALINEVKDVIKEFEIYNFLDLADKLQELNMIENLYLVYDNVIIFRALTDSMYHKVKRKQEMDIMINKLTSNIVIKK